MIDVATKVVETIKVVNFEYHFLESTNETKMNEQDH